MSVARRIAAARALRGVTQQQLAEQLQELSGERWTRSNIAALENEQRSMKVEELPLFAAVQGVDFAWYLDDSLPSTGRGPRPRDTGSSLDRSVLSP